MRAIFTPKAQTRIVEKTHRSKNPLFLAQAFAALPFNCWVTIDARTKQSEAEKSLNEFLCLRN